MKVAEFLVDAWVFRVATPLNADVFDEVPPFEQRALEDRPVRHLVPSRHHNIRHFLEFDINAPRILRVEGFMVTASHEGHRHWGGQCLPRGGFRDDNLTAVLVYKFTVGSLHPVPDGSGRRHDAWVGGNPLRHLGDEDSRSPPVHVVEPVALRRNPWCKVAQNGDYTGAVGVLEAVGVHTFLRCGSWYTIRQRVGPPRVAILDSSYAYRPIIEVPIRTAPLKSR